MGGVRTSLQLSKIVPEARLIVEQAARVYIDHAGEDFIGLIAHGSSVKGGFIAGCSDIDFQLYLRREAFDERGNFPILRSLEVQRDLAKIDPAPFQYLQCYTFGGATRDGWTGPIPGTYQIVSGVLPVPEASAEDLRRSAEQRLATIDPNSRFSSALLDHGGGRLARAVRLLSTDVWPALYSLLIVQGTEPIATWNLTKQAAMEALPTSTAGGAAIRIFYDALMVYYPAAESVDAALDVLKSGAMFLEHARDDFESRQT
jgi:hypothetical protein